MFAAQPAGYVPLHPPLRNSALEVCPAKMPQVRSALDRAARHRH